MNTDGKTTYRCAACDMEADFIDGRVVRRCGHDTEPISASVSAVVHAHGGMFGEDEAAPADG